MVQVIGTVELSSINIFGGLIDLLLIFPWAIYVFSSKKKKDLGSSSFFDLVMVSLFFSLMILNICSLDPGFLSIELFLIYLFGNIGLLTIYIFVWISFLVRPDKKKAVAAIYIGIFIFLLCGITLTIIPLIICSTITIVAYAVQQKIEIREY